MPGPISNDWLLAFDLESNGCTNFLLIGLRFGGAYHTRTDKLLTPLVFPILQT